MTDPGGVRVPLVEEHVEVHRVEQTIATNFVEVRTQEHVEPVAFALRHDRYEIERVAVGRAVDSAPPIRQEGEVTIVPILEEEVVVTRRLILREEVRLRRVTEVSEHRDEIVLRKQHAEIRRVPADDNQPGDQPGGHQQE